MTPTLFSLLALAAFSPALLQPTNALQGMGSPPVRRVTHVDLAGRMVRKRAVAPTIFKRQESATGTPTSPTASAPPRTTPPPPPASPTATQGDDDRGGLLDGILDEIGGQNRPPTTTITTNSVPTTTTTTSRPTTSQPSTTERESESSSSEQTSRSTANRSRTSGTITVSETATESATQSSDNSETENKTFLNKTVMYALIITAAVIAGAAALWTIIRKWKFSPSRHFEDRLEPLHWEPSKQEADARELHPAAIARGNSLNSQRSGVSGSAHAQMSTNAQPISMAPDFPPAHDFTAGPSHQNMGYSDIYRGTTPAPYQATGGYGAPTQYDNYGGYNNAYNNNGGYGAPRHY